MLYSEILKDAKMQEAFKAAGVHTVESPLLERNGDFSLELDGLPNRDRYLNQIRDGEILNRRSKQKIIEREKEFENSPEGKLKRKTEFIKPFVEKLVAGKIREPFNNLERALINVLAEDAAQRYDYDENGEAKHEDYSGLSELQKILKESSITRLSNKMSAEEIALRVFHDGPYASWVK